MSPELIVSTGFNDASKKPRWTVSGDAFNSCTFGAVWARAAVNIRQQATINRTFFIVASEGSPVETFSNSLPPSVGLPQRTDFVAATFVVGFSSTRYAWYATLPRFSIEWDG